MESARSSAARLFAASVVPAAMACVLAGVTAGGCAGTPPRDAAVESQGSTMAANEQRCWEAASQSHIVVCRAEARMRNARREGKLALFECYDDKVQQMHMQQRLGGRTGLPAAASTARSGESAVELRARADERIGELWLQLGECGIESSPAATVLASSNP